jgi:hypothetical protein
MKKFFLFVVVFCFGNNAYCQKTEEWKKYLQDSVYNSDNPKYVYLYVSKTGILVKDIHYNTKNGLNVLSINYGDSVITNKVLFSPNLFEIVERNLKAIKKIKDFLNTEKKGKEFRKNFDDSIKFLNQLGIRYDDLHYNHFPRFRLDEIENTKNKKRKQGMIIINQLYAILEEAEKSK